MTESDDDTNDVRTRDPVVVDGSDGGGGVLRTALGLSVATGRPVRIENVRGDRPTPGLKDQHVTCIEAARDLTNAVVDGAVRGSDVVWFDPGPVRGGSIDVDVGTAGSATLVCSAIMPATLVAERPFRLRVRGGTDVAWSPSTEYFAGVTLGILRAHGIVGTVDAPRRGFYPSGGGLLRLTAGPSTAKRIVLDDDPTVSAVHVDVVASTDLADADVAARLVDAATERLAGDTIAVPTQAARYAETTSTGAVITLRVEGRPTAGGDRPIPIAGFTALGEQGVPAETVAGDAVERFERWREGDGAVDEHLADQLVPYLALAGGRIRIPAVTDHVASAVAVARTFGFEITIDEEAAPGNAAVLRADGTGFLADGTGLRTEDG